MLVILLLIYISFLVLLVLIHVLFTEVQIFLINHFLQLNYIVKAEYRWGIHDLKENYEIDSNYQLYTIFTPLVGKGNIISNITHSRKQDIHTQFIRIQEHTCSYLCLGFHNLIITVMLTNHKLTDTRMNRK